jgi:hypothetical protein
MSLMDRVDLTGLDHLQLDTDQTLDGPPATALFSAGRSYRYLLTREWDDRPPAVFVMLNPSTADAFRLDPTLRRCRGFARDWGCGGFLVLNAFAFRATNPVHLRDHVDPVGPDNDAVIGRVLGAGGLGPVVLGWGSDVTLRRSGRDAHLVELLGGAGVAPMCLGVTNDGRPRHPLYMSASLTPVPFRQPAPA